MKIEKLDARREDDRHAKLRVAAYARVSLETDRSIPSIEN